MGTEPKPKERPLIPLSWEHHYGLVVSRRITLGIKNRVKISRIIPYILDVWEKYIEPHFQTEETLLLPAIKGETPVSREIIHKIETEHNTLRQLIESFRKSEGDTESLRNFATLLHDHIRFEERELFPLAETTLSRDKLKEIDGILYRNFKEIKDSWADKFWLS